MRDVNADWSPPSGSQKQPPPSDPANPGAPTPLRVDVHTGTFTDNEWVYFKVEDEICLGQWDTATGKFDTVYRGLFNTDVVTHDAGAEWTEVVVIAPYESDGPLETRYSKFTAGCTPEDVILTLLISGATQTAGDTRDNYRTVLPDGWGLGFDPNRIDMASFTNALVVHHANTVLGGVVAEPVVFSDWVKENILRPFGLYLTSHADDMLYCGLNQTGAYDRYTPSAGPHAGALRTIDSNEVIGVPKWRGAMDKVVGAIEFEGDAGLGQPQSAKVEVFVDAIRNYGGSWKTMTYKSAFLFSRNDVPGAVPMSDGSTSGMHAPYGRLRDYLQVRWTRAPGIATVKTRLSALDVELGATIQVDLPTLPSLVAASLGGVQLAQVIGKKVDDPTGVIEFELALFGYQMQKVPNWGACAFIASATAGVGTCTGRFYPYGPGYESQFFTVGDVVDVYSAGDLSRLTAATTITGVNTAAGTITATGIVSNCIVVPATFASCVQRQKDAGPFGAGSSGSLTGGVAPFRWSSR